MKIPVSQCLISSDFRTQRPDIGELALSIQTIGLINPITLVPQGEKYEVVAGRRRFLALTEILQYTELEVGKQCIVTEQTEQLVVQFEENFRRQDFTPIELSHLVKAIHDKKVKENGAACKGVQGGWGLKETASLISSDVTFVHRMLAIANNEDIVKDCKTLTEALAQIDKFKKNKVVEVVRKARVEKSRIAIDKLDIGDYINKLKCQDAKSFIATLPDESIDLIYTDPPFAINLDEVAGGITYKSYKDLPEDVLKVIRDIVIDSYRCLKPDKFAIFWCAFEFFTFMTELMTEAGYSVSSIPIVWVKTNLSGRSSNPSVSLGSIAEIAVYGWKGSNAEMLIKGKGNVFPYPTVRSNRIHVAQKPESLIIDHLNIFSLPGDMVADFCSGSGSTLRACFKSKRFFMGCEKEEEFYNSSILQSMQYAKEEC